MLLMISPDTSQKLGNNVNSAIFETNNRTLVGLWETWQKCFGPSESQVFNCLNMDWFEY